MYELSSDNLYCIAEFLHTSSLLNFTLSSKLFHNISLNVMKPMKHINNFIKCTETIENEKCIEIMESYMNFKCEGRTYINVKYQSYNDMIEYITINFELLMKRCKNADFHKILVDTRLFFELYKKHEQMIRKKIEYKFSSYSRFIFKYYDVCFPSDMTSILCHNDCASLWHNIENITLRDTLSVPIHGLLILSYIIKTGKPDLIYKCYENNFHFNTDSLFTITLIELARRYKLTYILNQIHQVWLYNCITEDVYAHLKYNSKYKTSPQYLYIMNLYRKGMLQFNGFCSRNGKSNHDNMMSDLNDYVPDDNSYMDIVYTEDQLLTALNAFSYNSSPSNINLFKYFRNHPELIKVYKTLLTSSISDRYNDNIMLASLVRSNPNFDYRFDMTEDARMPLINIINILYDALDGYILI
ncbi:hypothetical protein D3C87_759860 [compost metagenome]